MLLVLDMRVSAGCSVLMDHVPKRHRGKVNALDSVRTFSWSGSAALGGWAATFGP